MNVPDGPRAQSRMGARSAEIRGEILDRGDQVAQVPAESIQSPDDDGIDRRAALPPPDAPPDPSLPCGAGDGKGGVMQDARLGPGRMARRPLPEPDLHGPRHELRRCLPGAPSGCGFQPGGGVGRPVAVFPHRRAAPRRVGNDRIHLRRKCGDIFLGKLSGGAQIAGVPGEAAAELPFLRQLAIESGLQLAPQPFVGLPGGR